MNVLVLRASVRHTLRHPALIALSVLGIALGVGVTLGVDLANESARRAFDLSMERVTGAATHQIAGGPRGVGETLFRDLRVRHGVRNTAPVVEGHVRVGAETLQVLGIDPVSEVGFRQLTGEVGNDAGRRLMVESGAVLVSSKTASRLGLQIDNPSSIEVNGRQVPLLVVGLLEPRPESEDSRNKRPFSSFNKVAKTHGVARRPDQWPEIASFWALEGVTKESFDEFLGIVGISAKSEGRLRS